MRRRIDFERVRRLCGLGLSDYEVARQTGIPRSTVQHWRRRTAPFSQRRTVAPGSWHPPDRRAYSYLLGVFLGDGCIVVRRTPMGQIKSAFVQFYMDAGYPGLIAICARALRVTFPDATIGRYARDGKRLVVLQVSRSITAAAFPHHGVGPKHSRRIALKSWQRELIDAHPREFLRGLIHSDGCRSMNRFTVNLANGPRQYEYSRYFFSNLSADIRDLFCEYSDRLGIRWTQSNHRNISIADRRSVAILDTFVGPKR